MKKILIVEDNNDLREIYTTVFANNGYEAKNANTGLSGIVLAVDFNPDLILLDIMMPDMDGVSFLKALKENTSKNMPVFVFTNISDDKIYKECLDLGAKKVLLKADYTPSSIFEEVNSYLNA